MNTLKTGFLITLLTILMVLVGGLIGNQGGMVVAFCLALVMNLVSYWFSDKIVLGMYGARPISESESPKLHSIVERLARQAGIPKPRLYFVPGNMPNAFATGRNPDNSAVAVTEGLLHLLDSDEIEGVLAHEIAHIKNRDVLVSTIAATLAGAIMMLANMARWGAIFSGYGSRDDRDNGGALGLLIAAIVAPIAAMMIQMAVSRSREYQADETGAKVSGKPLSLANALLKLESAVQHIPAEVNPATAHMFIVNPLRGGGLLTLFSTHPPIPERVERLKVVARQIGQL
jgi:heat shock protein HtpX